MLSHSVSRVSCCSAVGLAFGKKFSEEEKLAVSQLLFVDSTDVISSVPVSPPPTLSFSALLP